MTVTMTSPAPARRTGRRVLDPLPGSSLRRSRDRTPTAPRKPDLLEVTYTTTDSPLGPLLLAGTPQGLVRLAFACEDHEAVLAQLEVRVSPRLQRAGGSLDDVRAQLDEYFAGRRRQFALDLDLRLSSGYRRVVLDHLRVVPYGQTQTYTQVAGATGSPRAVRAVGSACATNPVPIVVPCHRVLRSDGSLGGYLGGVEVKTRLLALEGLTGVARSRSQHLSRA